MPMGLAVSDPLGRRDDFADRGVRQSAAFAHHRREAAMPCPRLSIAAPLLLTLALAAGCDRHISWVDVDASGCNAARVSAMNRDAELVHQMGAVCAVKGKSASADRLRCHGNTLQVACRE